MLYIEDDNRDLWPAVASALASLEPLDMVLCLYDGEGPEAFTPPFQAPDVYEYLQPVKDHAEDEESWCSRRVPIDEELLAWLEQHTADFEDWGESLVAYRPAKYEVVAAAVPHEGIILVADEFGSALAATGFRLSSDTPDWW